MKIMHIETGRHLYGGALQVCYLMEALAQRGVENFLVCTKDSEIARVAAPYANIEAIPMHGDLDLLFPFRLSHLIRTHQPDIVHVHSRRGADLWAGFCAHQHKTPAIITRRVDNREWPPFARFKYRSYDRVISISEGIRQVLLTEGLAPKNVLCIHSVVKTENYQATADRAWFAEQFGIPVAAPVIGVIAQLIPRKGHRFLLQIAPQLISRFPNLRIVIFGQGPLRHELEKYVAEHHLTDVVSFAGFRNDMPVILPCLDLVVHPALMEGLGVSLLQAAAASIPIVGARAGGIPEIVRDGVNGLLVEPGSTDELYESIVQLLAAPSTARQFGRAGRDLVTAEFSITTMVEKYLDIYHELAIGNQ
ncbi:MAG: glycosyltransferase [Desulfuromonadaceae bacterium]|nr:glycosyltransferase [Desulfuromonadaceae bacterium]